MQILLAAGAVVDCVDRWDLTPADEAERCGHQLCLKLVLDAVAVARKDGGASADYGSTRDTDAAATAVQLNTRLPEALPRQQRLISLSKSSVATTAATSGPSVETPRSTGSSAGVRCARCRSNVEHQTHSQEGARSHRRLSFDMRTPSSPPRRPRRSGAGLLKHPRTMNGVDRHALQDTVTFKQFAIVNIYEHGASQVDEKLAFGLCTAASKETLHSSSTKPTWAKTSLSQITMAEQPCTSQHAGLGAHSGVSRQRHGRARGPR